MSQVECEAKLAQDLLTNYLCEQRQLISEFIDEKLENLVRLKYIVRNDMIMLNTAHGQEGSALVRQNYTKLTEVLQNMREFRAELVRLLNFLAFICSVPYQLAQYDPRNVRVIPHDKLHTLDSELLQDESIS